MSNTIRGGVWQNNEIPIGKIWQLLTKPSKTGLKELSKWNKMIENCLLFNIVIPYQSNVIFSQLMSKNTMFMPLTTIPCFVIVQKNALKIVSMQFLQKCHIWPLGYTPCSISRGRAWMQNLKCFLTFQVHGKCLQTISFR